MKLKQTDIQRNLKKAETKVQRSLDDFFEAFDLEFEMLNSTITPKDNHFTTLVAVKMMWKISQVVRDIVVLTGETGETIWLNLLIKVLYHSLQKSWLSQILARKGAMLKLCPKTPQIKRVKYHHIYVCHHLCVHHLLSFVYTIHLHVCCSSSCILFIFMWYIICFSSCILFALKSQNPGEGWTQQRELIVKFVYKLRTLC